MTGRWDKRYTGEAVLAAGGLLIIGLTLKLYPSFKTSGSPDAQPHLSPKEAERQVESAKSHITTHPEDMNTHVALAMAYFQRGPNYYVEAMNALDKARALGATSVHLFFYAGVMCDALGLSEYAINEFTKYLRHHPNDYETMVRLGNLQFRQKRIDEAQALYKAALHIWPKDATAWFNYAVINKEKGDYDEALSCLERVKHIAGSLPPGGTYEEGEIYRLKGDSEKALQLYQEELAAHPTYIPALEATDLIARARGDMKQSRELRKRIAEIKKQQSAAAS